MTQPRDRPLALLVVELEERPRLMVLAEHESDELRLRSWLERSGLWQQLTDLVEQRQAA